MMVLFVTSLSTSLGRCSLFQVEATSTCSPVPVVGLAGSGQAPQPMIPVRQRLAAFSSTSLLTWQATLPLLGQIEPDLSQTEF